MKGGRRFKRVAGIDKAKCWVSLEELKGIQGIGATLKLKRIDSRPLRASPLNTEGRVDTGQRGPSEASGMTTMFVSGLATEGVSGLTTKMASELTTELASGLAT